jgi:pimeloyl-ACP methyl ester carboxylesterase
MLSVIQRYTHTNLTFPISKPFAQFTMPKPTILIVPGSFSSPSLYDQTVKLLKEYGYPAVAIQLPSTVKRAPLEPATMMEDADVVRRAAQTLLSLGREVIVVPHSYGGTPTTQGLANLVVDGRMVKRIVYMTAVVPKIGQANVDALPFPLPAATGGYLHLDPLVMAGATMNDVPWEDAYPIALQLAHHSAASFEEKTTQAAYLPGEDGKTIPVSYVLCDQDQVISPEMQQQFIHTIEEASGNEVDVHRLEAGHCPNVSCTKRLVEILGLCAEKA